MSVIDVNDDNFEEVVLGSDKPVVVDFWAEWCAPCKQVAPHFAELAEEMGDKIKVVKLNVDDSPLIAGRFGVRGMPTFMIFQDGKVTATHLGAMNKSRIMEWVQQSAPSATA